MIKWVVVNVDVVGISLIVVSAVFNNDFLLLVENMFSLEFNASSPFFENLIEAGTEAVNVEDFVVVINLSVVSDVLAVDTIRLGASIEILKEEGEKEDDDLVVVINISGVTGLVLLTITVDALLVDVIELIEKIASSATSLESDEVVGNVKLGNNLDTGAGLLDSVKVDALDLEVVTGKAGELLETLVDVVGVKNIVPSSTVTVESVEVGVKVGTENTGEIDDPVAGVNSIELVLVTTTLGEILEDGTAVKNEVFSAAIAVDAFEVSTEVENNLETTLGVLIDEDMTVVLLLTDPVASNLNTFVGTIWSFDLIRVELLPLLTVEIESVETPLGNALE